MGTYMVFFQIRPTNPAESQDTAETLSAMPVATAWFRFAAYCQAGKFLRSRQQLARSPKEAAMTRSKLSSKVLLLVGGIGLSIAAFAGPAAAQEYYPNGLMPDPSWGCSIDYYPG